MSVARLHTDRARTKLQEFKLADLFIEELGWNQPSFEKPASMEYEGAYWQATEIAELSGFRVFEVTPKDKSTPLPDAKGQLAFSKRVALMGVENILIFVDVARTQSLWLWMKREEKRFVPRRHYFLKGQPGDLFLSKLAALFVDLSELDENGNVDITTARDRVQKALDVEAVTKVFFRDFKEEHGKLLDQIKGIPDTQDRRWYASVLLNRLMFVWFLQAKGFLDGGNRDYLSDLLAASEKKGRGQFFSHVLRDLFFEGFAKPASKRKAVGPVPLGDVPYLNGGLFLPHGIEQRIETIALLAAPYQKIRIADDAFADLFALFRRYSWSLNDTPGGDDREINPNVLGYIFEKYINQKEFGAYYTRPEITEYLCEQTIHELVLHRANANFTAAQSLHAQTPKTFPAPRRFTALDDLLIHADGPLCARLLLEVLPRLSLLDPAVGSGAFLVAAQKTLLNLYTGLLGRCEALGHRPVLDWIEKQKREHKAPAAYWLKKKIVTENLYGVDIMEEAVEIAKLRLFLSLVASAETRDQLEPLPNIEFNLLAGNSLIGLLHVDASRYDRKTGADRGDSAGQERIEFQQSTGAGELSMTFESKTAPTKQEKAGAFLATKRKAKYDELLREKNRLIKLYKDTGDFAASNQQQAEIRELTGLRDRIEAAKLEAREVLDSLLLKEFEGLGIQFQQATWDAAKKKEGKSEKRDLKLADIRALQPFHWAYEFDEILINRGGFDAIITNPPWETVEPKAKEFFAEHSELVTKNKMTIKDFEKEQARLLKEPEVMQAWLAYHSRFNHLRAFFRTSPQFVNQVPIIAGRRHGKDVNLYKLFLEQTVHLLHDGGRCGIVIPSGIYTDLGAMRLREMLFSDTRVTGIFGFENRRFIFEGVDSRFKFVVLTFEDGRMTTEFPVAFMRHDVAELASFPEQASLRMPVGLIRKLSPGSLSLMEFRNETDVHISERLFQQPLCSEPVDGKWQLELHREFNMTDDAYLFSEHTAPGRAPLFEGKMIWHFTHTFCPPRYWVSEKEARKALLGKTPDSGQRLEYQRYRLAYRDVAANTNERTLISTILPPGVFTGNTLVMASSPADVREMLLVSTMMNSLVVDFVIRQKVTNHCNMFYIYQLPIPRLTKIDAAFRPMVERAARLVGTTVEFDDLLREIFGKNATHLTHGMTNHSHRQRLRAELDALVAQAYTLTDEEFTHILATFPLVDESVKTQTRNTYRTLLRTGALPS